MRYADPRGLPEHRRAGARWASLYGIEAAPENVIVCSGAQHGLTCCLTGLFSPGDRIAVDCLTYPGFKTHADMLGVRLVPVPMDDQGMTPEGLDVACRRDRIKGLYLMPGVQNPTTLSMSETRRADIARLADKHDLLVIEDDAYALTSPETRRPVSAYAPHRAVAIAGLSKSIAAGLRVAFLVAPQPLLKPLAQSVLNTVWMTPPLNAEIAAMWINDGTAQKTVQVKSAKAARRYMTACDVLEGHRFLGSKHGFYIWLDLPDSLTGHAFEAETKRHGVNVFAAEKFTVGQTVPPNAARVSLTGAKSLEELEKGLKIVRDALDGRG